MTDRLLSDDDIEALCLCAGAGKNTSIEYQVKQGEAFKTVYYVHRDCPLHGRIRTSPNPAAPKFAGKPNDAA